jgi:hypothetical protein
LGIGGAISSADARLAQGASASFFTISNLLVDRRMRGATVGMGFRGKIVRNNREWLKIGLRRMKTFCVFGLLLAVAGCGSSQRPELAPEIPPGAMPREEARQRPSDRDGGNQPSSGRYDPSRYDLARDEERGGHTLAKHVGRSDDELRQRLDRERNISAASTWTDREAAEETVGAALRQEHNRIDSWERRGYPRTNLALHFDAERAIGRSMRHGDANSSPCTQAVIVLKADGPESFYVLTTYPEEQR